jgi:hypothetical protein
MRENRTSGSMSGDGKRSYGRTEAPPSRESGRQQLLPRPTATAPVLDSTRFPRSIRKSGHVPVFPTRPAPCFLGVRDRPKAGPGSG